ncbi:MAG: FtsQ-type POTRA domain-containing protein, partial [Coriobacteriales bacterium]|nr:FtsQ-type POTRA domain-containing protein [Coriobacteriales bacterium]
MRSPRQVRTGTPRVLDASGSSDSDASPVSPASRRSSKRQKGRRSVISSRNSVPSGRRPASSSSSKRRAVVSRKRGPGFALLVLIAVLVVLVGGFVALYFSNLFAITRVEVAGNEKLQSGYVLDLAAVPEDSTLLRTDVEGITGRLMAEPWVEEVEVERVFPDTLVLHITEQPVAAVVDIVPETANDTTQQWIIAGDCTWISEVNSSSNEGVQIDAEDFVALPRIRDVSAAVRPESGAVETDEGITNALALLKGFSSEMRDMVASISAPDAVKTTL